MHCSGRSDLGLSRPHQQFRFAKWVAWRYFILPMDPSSASRDRYLVRSVVHSSRVLGAFRSPGEALALREISSRSGLSKTMAFRLLYTLEKCGMVEKVGENLYQCCLRPWKQRLYRLGYAAQGTDYQFCNEVSASLKR